MLSWIPLYKPSGVECHTSMTAPASDSPVSDPLNRLAPSWAPLGFRARRAGMPMTSAPKRAWLLSATNSTLDRKSVVEGKSVSVSVDIGGRRLFKKKKRQIALDIKCEYI